MPPLTGHLEYYKQHGINPVRYDTSNLGLHLERRASLYRTLGITPLAIRGSRVLEVAPGTGQNSLYLANQRPASLTLVEPNPAGQRDIAAVYANAECAVVPEIIACQFEEFEPTQPFDLVVCENWLGDSDHERGLLRKLGGMVAEGGLLAVTAVSPVGVLPNLLRRALSNRLAPPTEAFADRTAILSQAFGSHLRTVGGMTRSVTDWVHDNMLNPAYLGVILTVPMVLDDLGASFDVLGSSPQFAQDWRWFKSLCGENRDFNRHILAEYHANLHNFLDHRTQLPARDARRNAQLEAGALVVAESLRMWEASEGDGDEVELTVRKLIAGICDLPTAYSSALNEFLDAFAEPRLTAETVAELPHFGPLFGRETVYLSFEKK
ncbi:MAG: class I SAM-dependent methyltransferase [Planctomycetes bacterium]|nr:class I SAM-dependent methyltransferase [Planctomycetota bacterium]